ncbi:MAG: glycosyltransferase family A protein [Thiohalocapsa sp.]
MTAPFFSIVIPVYNRSERLRRTLQSCVDQTFIDFEAVIVDDGSKNSDEIAQIVACFGDRRLRYIHRENGGGSEARNTGIDAAIGHYIAFLDSDDVFLPEKLALAHKYLSAQTEETAAWFSRIWVDRGISKLGIKPPRGPAKDEGIDDYLIRQRGMIQSSALVVARSVAVLVRWDQQLPYGQDTDFAVRLWEYGVTFHMYPDPLIIFDDSAAPGRVSSSRNYLAMLDWTDRMGDRLSRKAALAYRGWHAAKAARNIKPLMALRLYLEGLLQGAFSPKMAVISGLQVLLGPVGYRFFVDNTLKVVGVSRSFLH